MIIGIAQQLVNTLELRAGSVITEQEITALKKRWRPRGRLAQLEPDTLSQEACDLHHHALPMRVSDEQGKKGQDYLRKLLLTKQGDLRKTKLVIDNCLTDGHVRVINGLDHFMFMGFREDYNFFGECVALYPIYRAVAHGGLPEFGYIGQDMT